MKPSDQTKTFPFAECPLSPPADELHTFVSEKKADWEEYSQKQCEDYEKKLQSDYEGGTVAGPSYAVYKYELQKEWLKQIVGIYEQLNT